MQPFSTGVYVNFMSDEPADRLRAVYGPDKYERLIALKRRYDPDNVFGTIRISCHKAEVRVQAKSMWTSRGEPFVGFVDRFCCFPADV